MQGSLEEVVVYYEIALYLASDVLHITTTVVKVWIVTSY